MTRKTTRKTGQIHIGIGGWNFAPWRGEFYPKGLTQAKELAYAGERLTSIEINSTYYGSQKPESFRKWAGEVPDGFVFAVKGPRFATNRRVLAEAGDSIRRFIDSGVTELGDKLGPVNWQFAPTKTFDPDDMAAFLDLLPRSVDGIAIRHALEARHDSFADPDFAALCRKHGVAIVCAGDGKYPQIADVTADFVYARIMGTTEKARLGYAPKALDAWAKRAEMWASGSAPEDLPTIAPAPRTKKSPRDVFLYVIHEGKLRAPAAAEALIARLGTRD